jgi:TonB-dependent receptor
MWALGALGTLMSLPASAADSTATNNPAADAELSEIIVTGLRQSVESAQVIKQNAEEIVDSVTAQDIGALPDRSIAEAMQRIPGITLSRTDSNRDPARLTSDGGNIFIRGLPWVSSQVNGHEVFSATDGRAITWEDFSADLLSGIDVYKNPAADQIEGGIGGIVNLRSRQPFDSDKAIVAISADDTYSDLIHKGFASGNILLSDTWQTGIGKVGALFSYSLGNAGNRSDAIQTGAFQKETTSTGETVYLPNSFGWRSIDWQQKRESASAALQWAPTDHLLFGFQALLTQANPLNLEHTLGDDNDLGEDTTPQPGNVYGANGIVQSGSVNPSLLTTDTRFEQDHKSTKDFSLNFKWTPGNWTISGDVQHVQSHADLTSFTAYTQLSNATPGMINYNLTGTTPSLNFTQSPSTTANQGAYWWGAAMDHLEYNDAHSWAERLDADYRFDDNPWLQSLRLGVRATDKEAITRETGWNWGFLSNAFWNGGASSPGAAYLNNTAQVPGSASSLYNFPNFFNGKVPSPGPYWFASSSLVSSTAAAYNILKNTETSGWGWSPLVGNYFQNAQPAGDNSNGGINDQHEKTFAAYLLARFAHPTPIGPMDGNIGVRVVHTETDTNSGLLRIGGLPTGTPATCATADATAIANNLPPIDCTAFDAAYAFAQGGNQNIPGASQSYNDVLPTLNIRFKLEDNLQWRFAGGRAMSRPNFSQLQNSNSLNFAFTGFTPSAGTGYTATAGNPNLKPTIADQFDTSLEWYFAPAGSLTGDLFYKKISNYTSVSTAYVPYTSNGVTEQFFLTQNADGGHGTIKGLEMAYSQFYDFLPGPLKGLGLQMNYTFVNSQGGSNTAQNIFDAPEITGATSHSLPIEGISKHTYNIAGLYERYGISARLAYNWRAHYLLTSSAANINLPVWAENYGQLDASVFYSITPNVKVGVQAENLLDTRTFLDVGYQPITPRYSWSDTDRRVSLAIRAKL